MLITSREYKVMLDHRMFYKRKRGLRDLWEDLLRAARQFCVAPKEGDDRNEFGKPDRRTIRFLDTPNATLRNHQLILRQRQKFRKAKGKLKAKTPTFTLKCRTEDRYLAAGRCLQLGLGLELDEPAKFEEDIAAPFRSRFSHSVTIKFADRLPETIAGASRLFPALAGLNANGLPCPPETPLEVVNGLVAHEHVFTGPTFHLGEQDKASIAVIVWSHQWKSRPIAAELSFRYGNLNEQFSADVAQKAFDLFETIQTLEWCLPGAATKTQLAYGD